MATTRAAVGDPKARRPVKGFGQPWYPGLFYKSNEGQDPRLVYAGQGTSTRPVHDSDLDDVIVADVHSDPPDMMSSDPGAVLHEGVGKVYYMLIAVDNGPDRMVYAGPVFSHFEFLTPYGVRLTDADWKQHVNTGARPAHPEWTRAYLKPSGRP